MGITEFYFSFKGRISRAPYWFFWFLPGIMVLLFINTLATYNLNAGALAFPLNLLFLWVLLAVNAKRLHDLNKSGWWQLIALIPVVGWIPLFIACGFIGGTPGLNDYDDDDEPRESYLPEPQPQIPPPTSPSSNLRIARPPRPIEDKEAPLDFYTPEDK